MIFPPTRADSLEYIAAYNKERNEMLIKLDIVAMREFQRKWHQPIASNDEVAMITLHKTITGVESLPREFRQASYRWLTERGYTTKDDGDLAK